MNEEKKYNLPAYINIPLFLYKDEKLTRTHLLLSGFIYSLHTAGKVIKVKNDYLSEMLDIHERKVPEALEHLEKLGYLIRIGLGTNRKIKWIFDPESSITVEELHNPAPNGTLPQTAGQPCPKRHPYIKDNNNLQLVNTREPKNSDWDNHTTAYELARTNSPKEIALAISDSEKSFRLFWAAYPVKKAEGKAKAAWLSQGCHHIATEILQKLELQLKKDIQFLEGKPPHPATYIFDERWKDEIQIREKKSSGYSLSEVMGA